MESKSNILCELFANRLTYFAKSSILDVWQGFEYPSECLPMFCLFTGVIKCKDVFLFLLFYKQVLKKKFCAKWCCHVSTQYHDNHTLSLYYHYIKIVSLSEKCPNTELVLLRIFPRSDWIRRDTVSLRIQSESGKMQARNNSVFWTLSTQYCVKILFFISNQFWGSSHSEKFLPPCKISIC